MSINSHDPINHLPYEIWIKTMIFAIADPPEGPLLYLTVSTRWQEMILDTPQLWTTIVIDKNSNVNVRMETFLHLSGQHLIDVSIGDIPNYDSPLLDRLVSEAHRMQSLVFPSFYKTTPGMSSFFKKLAEAAPTYPQMQRLELNEDLDGPSFESILSLFPNLTCLGDDIVSSFMERIIPPGVEELRLELQWPLDSTELINHHRLRSLLLIYPNVGRLPNQEIFTVSSNHMRGLAASLGHSLQYLTIKSYKGIFSSLLALISSLPVLESLELEVYVPGGYQAESLERQVPHKVGRVRQFKLEISVPFEEWNLVSNDTEKQTFVAHLIAWHIRLLSGSALLQNLQSFELSAPRFAQYRIPLDVLLHSITTIESLVLSFSTMDDDDIQPEKECFEEVPSPVIMSKLRNLSLRPACLLRYMSTPKLLSLKLSEGVPGFIVPGYVPSVSRLTASSVIIQSLHADTLPNSENGWQSLEELSFHWHNRLQCIMQLTSPRIVEIHTHYYSDPGPNEFGVNGFLLDLLRNLNAFPFLTTIRSDLQPCWELLFEVLRQRHTANLPRLKMVSLACIPSFPILWRLVKLLQGYMIYTTRDIDLAILRRLLEPQPGITDCTTCLMSGYSTCIGRPLPDPQDYFSSDAKASDVLDLDDLENSDTGRYEGWKDWEARIQDPTYQNILTPRGDEYIVRTTGWVHITEDTLDGVSTWRGLWH